MFKWPLLTLAMLIGCQDGSALEIRGVQDNQTISTKISSLDVTRLAVKGDRITRVRGVKGSYFLEKDEDNGDVYIQPSSQYQEHAFSILIQTEQAHHYTLLLDPIAVPSDPIVLIPNIVQPTQVAHRQCFSSIDEIIELIRSMVNNIKSKEFVIQLIHNQKHDYLSNMASLRLITVYESRHLRGEVFEVTNITSHTLTLDERDFFKHGTKAVSFRTRLLLPYQKTQLYRALNHA